MLKSNAYKNEDMSKVYVTTELTYFYSIEFGISLNRSRQHIIIIEIAIDKGPPFP